MFAGIRNTCPPLDWSNVDMFVSSCSFDKKEVPRRKALYQRARFHFGSIFVNTVISLIPLILFQLLNFTMFV